MEHVYEYLDRDYMKEIASGIQEQLSSKATLKQNILFAIFPVVYEGKKSVRFNLITVDTWRNNYAVKQPFDSAIFNDGYYEVDFETFKKFIRYSVRENISPRPKPNNGMHPTALSVPLINLASCDVACVVSSGGG